jgi:hypothetical protein
MDVWTDLTAIKSSFVYKGDIYLQDGKKGLLKMVNGKLQPMPGAKEFTGKRIAVFLPYSNNKILCGNKYRGFFLYDGQSTI